MTSEGGPINPNTFASELRTPRWGMDLVVCWMAACAFYLWVVWSTLMFETSLPKPQKLIGDMLYICLAYTLSVFAGRFLKRQNWSTAIWIPLSGSILLTLIWVGPALLSDILSYIRSSANGSLTTMPFSWVVSTLFWMPVALTIVTITPAVAARGLVWLYLRRFSKMA